ncbi:hypothetical protein FZEAL_1143 [Fusarium zealandicum]|uniref:Xylanolytic transcriptional activator regulatory domain-containing protein n=1 Tax=Fusarium zealandicum TaxID=1053134 RepID=A0A8H4UTR5_9HYPO|nr:hypothetical protein FZEAL_1143 [Fusarium zealandicum]
MSGPRSRAPFCQSEALFSAYRFLKIKDLSGLDEQDVQFLELKGCFHVPLRPIQEEFIYQYFLYIHPCYPLIDEAQFWDMYLNGGRNNGSDRTMPLLVFQAMLFASSAFVSPAVLKNAGYTGVKAARSIFYRRAKLLFDFGVESDAFIKSQAALLLTFEFSAAEPHTGSLWLSIAIQNAVVAQAHIFQAPGSNRVHKKRNKRLWWSLYWRDRVLTLGLRRPMQITPSSFNVQLDTFTFEDLKDEAHHSVVYDPKTKRHLTEILIFQCRLGVLLTEILAITYGPSAFDPTYSLDHFEETLSQIRTAKSRLARWKEDTEAAFYVFLGDGSTHQSLSLFSSQVYIYAHAAQIALCNHEAMVIEQLQKGVTVLDEAALKCIGEELNLATTQTTRLVTHIVRQGLTQHLPISAIAYIAFPLMLSSLDDKLSTTPSGSQPEQAVSRCHAQAMHLSSKRFDGAEDISKMITQILNSTPIQLPIRHPGQEISNRGAGESNLTLASLRSSGPTKSGASLDEIFVTRLYLRLRWSLDYALITGKPPMETDLPSYILRGGTRKLTLGPVNSLSAAMLGTSYEMPTFRNLMRQALDSENRVVEIDDRANRDGGSSTLSGGLGDTVMDGGGNTQARNADSVFRNSWEYDPIWAANLFEEMTDVLWG